MRSVPWRAAASAVACIALTSAFIVAPDGGKANVAWAQERGGRSWLGIAMRQDKAAGRVYVSSVVPGSPAEAAGVRSGDLIVWIAGRTVHQPSDVAGAVSRLAPGSAVQLIVERDGARQTLSTHVERMPSTEQLMKRQLVGRPAPAWQGLVASGAKPGPTLAGLRGRVVVLDFWTSWCTACGLTMRHLNQWNAKYRARGLTVVGLAPEPEDQMEAAAQRLGIQYLTAADPTMDTTESYQVSQLPTLVVIDRKGTVRDVSTGYSPSRVATLEALVVKLLAEAP